MRTVVIDPRFNGPPGSANGGYTCGVVAELLGAAAATVTLRLPPPLGRELTVHDTEGRVELRDGDTLVAEGEATGALTGGSATGTRVPRVDAAAGANESASRAAADPVHPDAGAAAARAGREAWADHHPFPTCFVCGPEREPADGLSIFPSPLGDGRYAAAWTPAAELADADGVVHPRYVWAALDCPTAAPCMNPNSEPAVVLARLEARIDAPIHAGEPHALVSWPIAADGRKRRAGAALFDAAGALLASSEALWIEVRA